MSYKVSSKHTSAIIEEMKNNGISDEDINKIIGNLEKNEVITSTNRGSIQFKDEDGVYWRASLTWKSVEGKAKRKDSKSMIQMKEYFDKGREKFGQVVV